MNNKGFGIVQMTVAAAVLGGLSLVVMNINKQTNSTQKKFQTDIDADFIAKEIAGIIADPAKCLSNFNGMNAASNAAGTILNIKDKNGIAHYAVSTTAGYGTSHIKVFSYSLSNTGSTDITNTNIETALVINYAMPNIVSAAASLKPRRVKLVITKAGANINSCLSAWVNSQDYWSKNGNDIFYTGMVGIGINPPTERLQVNGNLRLDGVVKPGFFMSS